MVHCSWFMVHSSLFIVHSAQGYQRTPHIWSNLRVCAKFGGFFSAGNGVSRCGQRSKKICGSRVFVIWWLRFCAKKRGPSTQRGHRGGRSREWAVESGKERAEAQLVRLGFCTRFLHSLRSVEMTTGGKRWGVACRGEAAGCEGKNFWIFSDVGRRICENVVREVRGRRDSVALCVKRERACNER